MIEGPDWGLSASIVPQLEQNSAGCGDDETGYDAARPDDAEREAGDGDGCRLVQWDVRRDKGDHERSDTDDFDCPAPDE